MINRSSMSCLSVDVVDSGGMTYQRSVAIAAVGGGKDWLWVWGGGFVSTEDWIE